MDIRDRKTEAMTAAGLNLIAQALSIYDSDLRLAVCNLPFKQMFGLPDHLVTPGARFEDTIRHLAVTGEYGPVEDVEAFVAVRVAQARTFEPHYMERTRANGRMISVEGSPLPQGGWVTVYTDISRAKRVEQLLRSRSEELSGQLLAYAEELSSTNRELASTITALEEAKRQLTEAEARTRLTTEMMPAHIAHVDPDGHYTFSNRRLTAVMPGRPMDILGAHIRDVLGPAFAKIESYLEAAYRGTPSVFEFTDPVSARRIRGAFTPDGAGGVYILSMDITEETQARAALQQSRRRAMAAQLTSGMAHDFSNLLTIILGMQSKLARSYDLPPEAYDLVEATRAAARRGGRLLNRIADMTGHRRLTPEPTDLHALLQDLKTLAAPSLPRAMGLSVVDHTPDDLLLLDGGMLQDALLNLVLNARDACGAAGLIAVTAHKVSDLWVEITVSDTGPGFSPTALREAINPFFTTKGGEGSGLGLPMVYDMVKLAGGDLRLANGAEGAVVTLRLPYRVAPDAGGGLALLVEDSDELRAQLREMLIGLGYSVAEAASADEAVALAADLPEIALVLTDLQLAGEATGLDLLDRLGGDAPPILVMTALPQGDPLHRAAAARAPVLRKPVAAADLAALLRPRAAE